MLISLLLIIMNVQGHPWPPKPVRAEVMRQLLGHLAALLTGLSDLVPCQQIPVDLMPDLLSSLTTFP